MNLFDILDVPASHTGDPATSVVALVNLGISGRRVTCAKVVIDLVTTNPGLTAHELWQAADDEQRRRLTEVETVKKRLSDLVSVGHVVQGEVRTCRVRNTKMVTWRIPEVGEKRKSHCANTRDTIQTDS